MNNIQLHLKSSLSLISLLIVLAINGCTVQLAPQYDQSILDGLISTNKSAQIFFASLGTQVEKETYQGRTSTYANLIGSLNALEVQSKSRPIPPDADLTKINNVISKNTGQAITNDPDFSDYPSARAIHDASTTLQAMQNMDKSSGLRGMQLKALENQVTVYLSQAITYETFLKR
jgi:hypothetical protein